MKQNVHKRTNIYTKNVCKIKLTALCISLLALNAYAQTPTGAPPANTPAAQSAAAWYRGGNSLINGPNNIFGTVAGFNTPIYTRTNGITRTRLNGTLTTPINGVNQNVSGFFGIGLNSFFDANSPWSMLHLEGPNNL